MPGVNVPQSQQGPMNTIVPMAGAAVGGFFGGPAGAVAGQKVGAGLVSGGPAPTPVQSASDQVTPGAISRRLASMDDNPSVQLAKADAALRQLPPEMQQQYGPTIAAARQADSQGGSY